jgi:hypothetical protein
MFKFEYGSISAHRIGTAIELETAICHWFTSCHHRLEGERMAMSTQSLPSAFSFPLDVERLIFEEAARNDIQSAVQLALVCRRVQSWLVN